jgi:hypothetical protein
MYVTTALARLAALLTALAFLGGCKVVVATPSAPVTAQQSAATSRASSAAASGALASISDEGMVTYSTRLTRCHAGDAGQLPDRRCTPGSVDPAVTQATIGSTICRPGYTARVRPPSSETTRAKYDVAYPAYGIPQHDHSELDHLVSLELGGSNDITNLWPEVGSLPNPKDKVENALHRAVCDGQVPLRAAQRAIASGWMNAETGLGLP